MRMLQEFKTFALRGNVIDLAIGVVIGAAFGKIVTSFVNDIILPPIGILVGGVNFSDLKLIMKEAVGEQAAVSLNYGAFLQVCFDFFIIAVAVFMAVKAINQASKKKTETPTPPAPIVIPDDIKLLTEIRDLLKK